MFSSIFLFLFAQAPATDSEAPVELPAAIAQQAAAEALEAKGLFSDAGNAYVKLADLPGVDRRRALDKAHASYDSAYSMTKDPSRLCWALRVAQQVIQEGAFSDADQASYWQDTVDDDLRRLQVDAQTTRRINCRFDPNGAPRALLVTTLTDNDFTGQDLAPDRPHPRIPAMRRRRVQTASGAMLTGAGIGMLGLVAGVLELERQRAVELRGLIDTAQSASRTFTEHEARRFRDLADDLLRGRDVAISIGVAGLVTLGTGIALLATRKRTRTRTRTRAYALQPYGGPQGAGAQLRLKF